MGETANGWTVRDLRRRWKPIKQRLLDEQPDHPTGIRIHRACSWLAHVEQLDGELDVALVCQWIAFNSLYGRWDEHAREPRPDRECWQRFLERILALDADGRVAEVLTTHRKGI